MDGPGSSEASGDDFRGRDEASVSNVSVSKRAAGDLMINVAKKIKLFQGSANDDDDDDESDEQNDSDRDSNGDGSKVDAGNSGNSGDNVDNHDSSVGAAAELAAAADVAADGIVSDTANDTTTTSVPTVVPTGGPKDVLNDIPNDTSDNNTTTVEKERSSMDIDDLEAQFAEAIEEHHAQLKNDGDGTKHMASPAAIPAASVEPIAEPIPEPIPEAPASAPEAPEPTLAAPVAAAAPSLFNKSLDVLPLKLVAPPHLPANVQLLINTIPSLDIFATQILRIIVATPYQKILDLVANNDTLEGMSYQTLISMFDNIKNLYSSEDPFLSIEHLTFGMWKEGKQAPDFLLGKEDTIIATIRKVNLATFLNATLGTMDIGFYFLNESFLDVFCPGSSLDISKDINNLTQNSATTIKSSLSVPSASKSNVVESMPSVGKLSKSQATLYLELKTQAYISAIETNERTKESILEDIFPKNLEIFLIKRKNPMFNFESANLSIQKEREKYLTPSELEFISRCQTRKEKLLNATIDEDLSEKYDWLAFLKDFFEFSKKLIGTLVWGSKSTFKNINTSTTTRDKSLQAPQKQPQTQVQQQSQSQSQLQSQSQSQSQLQSQSQSPKYSSPLLATESTTKDQPQLSRPTPNTSSTVLESLRNYNPDLLPSEIQIQYRETTMQHQAAMRHLHRRPWIRSEELALKEGLKLKGPFWSEILELYGAGGSISEALKNRTQVQLKDKARNWKIFFLKNGIPVPDYLADVTGDLNRGGGTSQTRLKKGRKSAKNRARPQKIQQKDVDAAAAASSTVIASENEEKAHSEQEKDDKQERPQQVDDENNMFVQLNNKAAERPAQSTIIKEVENNSQAKTPLSSSDANEGDIGSKDAKSIPNKDDAADLGTSHKAVVSKSTETPENNPNPEDAQIEHPESERKQHGEKNAPDYDNILKNLIVEATDSTENYNDNVNNETVPQESKDSNNEKYEEEHEVHDSGEARDTDEVQRLVEQVIAEEFNQDK